MKLKNKLIPLLAMLTTSTVVIPTISSCSTYVLTTDITNGYTPVYDKVSDKIGKLTDEQAQEYYFNEVINEPGIIADDIYKFEADKLPSRIRALECPHDGITQEYIVKNFGFKIGVNNTSVKKASATISSKTYNFYTLSLNLKCNFIYTQLSVNGNYEISNDITYRVSIQNIPTFLYSANIYNNSSATGSPKRTWFVSNVFTSSDLLSSISDWYYEFGKEQETVTKTVDELGHEVVSSQEYSDSGKINTQKQLDDLFTKINPASPFYTDKYISYKSYHMSDVLSTITPKEQILKFKTDESKPNIVGGSYEFKTDANTISTDVDLFELNSEDFKTATKKRIYIGKDAPTTKAQFDAETIPTGIPTSQIGLSFTPSKNDFYYYLSPSVKNYVDNIQLYSHANTIDTEKVIISDENVLSTQDFSLYDVNVDLTHDTRWGSELGKPIGIMLLNQGQRFGYAWYSETSGKFESDTYVLDHPIYLMLSKTIIGE